MENFSRNIDLRWSDLDPNFHVAHSRYYEFGAFARICFLEEKGMPASVFIKEHFGPILFREECLFKRELRFGDRVSINLVLRKVSRDYSKWSMQHEIWKNEDTLAAIINVDGAWMDTVARKIIPLPDAYIPLFNLAPKSVDFELS